MTDRTWQEKSTLSPCLRIIYFYKWGLRIFAWFGVNNLE